MQGARGTWAGVRGARVGRGARGGRGVRQSELGF